MPTGTRGRVVDASALAALLFGEPAAEEMAERLGKEPLLVPSLLRYEVGSVCRKKIGRYPDRRDALLGALDLLSELNLREVQVPVPEVVTLAREENVTVYDAAYLWLARWLGTGLVTLDAELERRART